MIRFLILSLLLSVNIGQRISCPVEDCFYPYCIYENNNFMD